MIYIPFSDFIYEKLNIPKVDFVSKILFDIKHNFIKDLIDSSEITEDVIVEEINKRFKKYRIIFTAYYTDGTSIRNFTNKEYASLGIGGAITLLNGDIYIIILSKFFENFDKKYADRLYKRFVDVISSIISHELIHREQLSKMNVKYIEKLASGKGTSVATEKLVPYTYYSNEQEISAFASQTIDDLLRHKFRKSTIIDFIKNPKSWIDNDVDKWATEKNFKKFSISFIMYYILFKDVDREVWNKYMKYVHYFLEKVEN